MVNKYWPIGTKVYAIHSHYVNKSPIGGKIIPCKVITYENINGIVEPICKKIGSKIEPGVSTHVFYSDIKEALKVLSRKTKK